MKLVELTVVMSLVKMRPNLVGKQNVTVALHQKATKTLPNQTVTCFLVKNQFIFCLLLE